MKQSTLWMQFGYYYFEIGILFRNSMLINWILCSIEALYGLNNSHVEKLEKCDNDFYGSATNHLELGIWVNWSVSTQELCLNNQAYNCLIHFSSSLCIIHQASSIMHHAPCIMHQAPCIKHHASWNEDNLKNEDRLVRLVYQVRLVCLVCLVRQVGLVSLVCPVHEQVMS